MYRPISPVAVLFGGLPGVRPTVIHWGETLPVLFGPNGSGKSRMLRALRGVFSGQAEPSEVSAEHPSASLLLRIGRLDEDEAPFDDSWGPKLEADSDFLTAFVSAVDTDVLPWENQPYDVERGYVRRLRELMSLGRFGDEKFSRLRDHPDDDYGVPDEIVALVQEVTSQRIFEWCAADGGGWKVRPFVLGEPGYPSIERHVEAAYERAAANRDEPAENSPIYLQEFWGLDGGRVVGGAFFPGLWTAVSRGPEWWSGIQCLVPDDLSEKELSELTGQHLASRSQTAETLEQTAATLNAQANERLQSVLPAAPHLVLEVPDHREMLAGSQVKWTAAVPGRYRDSRVDFSQLSFAEQRWAALAIIASSASAADSIVLVDEPERGLHRALEHRVATQLPEFFESSTAWVWAASHSPAVLQEARITPVGLQVDSTDALGRRSARALASREREALSELGLTPLDILGTKRGFLLVEGTHDEAVFQTLLSHELEALAIELIPLHGGKNVARSIDSIVLFDYTDALLFAVLDAIPVALVESAWQRATTLVHGPGTEAAKNALLEDIPSDGTHREEVLWLRQWLVRAIETHQSNRVHPLGLARADVIEYLPASSLVEGGTSWQSLREEHAKLRRDHPQRTAKDFKAWLRQSNRATFERSDIVAACAAMDEVPDELTRIANQMARALGQTLDPFPV